MIEVAAQHQLKISKFCWNRTILMNLLNINKECTWQGFPRQDFIEKISFYTYKHCHMVRLTVCVNIY